MLKRIPAKGQAIDHRPPLSALHSYCGVAALLAPVRRGAYEALADAGLHPHRWVAGILILGRPANLERVARFDFTQDNICWPNRRQ